MAAEYELLTLYLAFPGADCADMQDDQKVIPPVTHGSSDLFTVFGAFELVNGCERDTVVDCVSFALFEHAVVDLPLNFRRKGETRCCFEGLTDEVDINVRHHKHLLGIVLDLVLRPCFMDDPN